MHLWMRNSKQVTATGDVIVVGLESAGAVLDECAAAIAVVDRAALVGGCIIEEDTVGNRRRTVVVVDCSTVVRCDIEYEVALANDCRTQIGVVDAATSVVRAIGFKLHSNKGRRTGEVEDRTAFFPHCCC